MKNTTLLVTSSVLSMGSMAAVFDDLARTPPMGWNSWNLFDKDITEQDVMQMADAMVSSGMAEAGYEYIVLDTGWQSGRDSHCQVMTDQERFPHGMRSLADYLHAKGLKFGIYASPPSPVRPEFSGSNGNDLIDAMTYSHWDLDYLKYNWYYSSLSPAPNFYTMMQQALYAVARPVVFRAREGDTFPAMKKTGRQSLSGGAINGWEAMIDIFDRQNKLVLKSGYVGGEPLADRTKANSRKIRQSQTLTCKFSIGDSHHFNLLAEQEFISGQGDNTYIYATKNSQLANPDLKWETTITRNAGLDFGLWGERLSGTIEVYRNSADDLLIEREIVAPGYETIIENVGETSNKGLEISLNAFIIEKQDFSVSANFNIGFNRSKVENLADGIDLQTYASGWAGTDLKGYKDYHVKVGEPVGLIYG
jgi:hypothetical protein